MLLHYYKCATKVKNIKRHGSLGTIVLCVSLTPRYNLPIRVKPPVTLQRAVMDFSGAESDLEAERDIEKKKPKTKETRKVYNTQLSIIELLRNK